MGYTPKRQLGTHDNVMYIVEKPSAYERTLLFYRDSFGL